MDFGARNYAFAEYDPPVVVAEIGVNHNGDPELARRLVDAAVAVGADIVKFQAFKTEREISRFAALAPYQAETQSAATSQFDLCKTLELSNASLRELRRHSEDRGVGFLCSTFDFDSFDFLANDLRVKAVKLGSGEITNHPFLERIARHDMGVILSTGASTLDEVKEAVATLSRAGSPEIVLLHCVSSYPAPLDQLNLRAMRTLKEEFSLPVGFSDHTIGIEAAVAAVALGAVAIEKHFTLDRSMAGPDHRASAEPDELKRLVAAVRSVKAALGDGTKRPAPSELTNRPLIRKGLVAKGRLYKGQRLTHDMIEIKRPAHGIDPREIDKAIGRELARDLDDDEPITWASLA